MARPATWKDIPEHERCGDLVINWATHNVMSYPSIAKHLIYATEAAEKLGLIVTGSGVYETLSPERLDANLLAAQQRWDELKEKYEVAVDFPGQGGNDMYTINAWARENGRPSIKPSLLAS